MTKVLRCLFVTFLFFFIVSPGILAADESGESEGSLDVMGKIEVKDYVEVLNKKIYLPRIYVVNGSFYFYGSTRSAIESGEFVSREGEIVRADGTPVTLDFSVSSHLIFIWLGLVLTFLMSYLAARRYKRGIGSETEPKGTLQNIFEVFFVFVRDDIAKEYIPDGKHHKYVNYLFSIFWAITFMNLFGLLPWGITPTSNLTVTATLAAMTFFVTQFSGTRHHWEHVFMFPGVHPLIRVILTPVEIIGLFTKPFALAIRLFANMLSGKIMIICILGLIFIFTDLFGAAFGASSSIVWVGLTALLYILKAFIALLQAYIFTLLSAVFIGMAAEEYHHEPEESSVVRATEVNI